jgi:phosphoenolpyruvate carboxykinase (ATP)
LIWGATNRFGAILENVVYDENTRQPDFNSDAITENTRSAYPLHFLKNIVPQGSARHPRNIFFLTADAFGILPPIAALTPDQAMYYFLSGYTSKLAGTEKGLGKEPLVTFSTCFGEPFLPLHPRVYAKLLGEKIKEHHTQVWLVNTGWTGGPYGSGSRIPLPQTRAMISAAIEGKLSLTSKHRQPFFNLEVPSAVPGIPSRLLIPRETWPSPDAYDQQARNLVTQFQENFKQYSDVLPIEVLASGPQL